MMAPLFTMAADKQIISNHRRAEDAFASPLSLPLITHQRVVHVLDTVPASSTIIPITPCHLSNHLF